MASKYFILLVVLGVFAAQSAASDINNPSDVIQGLIDKAKELLQKLEEAVANALQSAKETLKDLEEKIKNYAYEVMKNAEQTIDEEAEKVKEQIDDIAAKAKAIGINITDCVSENKQDISNVGTRIINDLKKCVTDEVDTIEKTLKDALKNIIDIAQEISSLPAEISECLNAAEKAECITKLTVRIIKDIISVPDMISSTVSKVVHLVTGMESQIARCGIETAVDMSADASAAAGNVVKCYEDRKKSFGIY